MYLLGFFFEHFFSLCYTFSLCFSLHKKKGDREWKNKIEKRRYNENKQNQQRQFNGGTHKKKVKIQSRSRRSVYLKRLQFQEFDHGSSSQLAGQIRITVDIFVNKKAVINIFFFRPVNAVSFSLFFVSLQQRFYWDSDCPMKISRVSVKHQNCPKKMQRFILFIGRFLYRSG